MTVAIGCTGGKHRSVAMTEEIAAPAARTAAIDARRRSTATWGGSDVPQAAARSRGRGARRRARPRRVARRALRRVVDDLTAVVTVADDGGSSGRLREEFGVLPPGDLRMALAALCGDDEWGQTWARVLQHRFAGDGEMRRPRGRQPADRRRCGSCSATTSQALDWVGRLLGAAGRVLPMALTPLDITAEVRGARPGATPTP